MLESFQVSEFPLLVEMDTVYCLLYTRSYCWIQKDKHKRTMGGRHIDYMLPHGTQSVVAAPRRVLERINYFD